VRNKSGQVQFGQSISRIPQNQVLTKRLSRCSLNQFHVLFQQLIDELIDRGSTLFRAGGEEV
jgi:hypothetical protein